MDVRESEVVTARLDCLACANGLLAFMVRYDGAVFLECLECMNGYEAISNGELCGAFWDGAVSCSARYATVVEVVDAGYEGEIR